MARDVPIASWKALGVQRIEQESEACIDAQKGVGLGKKNGIDKAVRLLREDALPYCIRSCQIRFVFDEMLKTV